MSRILTKPRRRRKPKTTRPQLRVLKDRAAKRGKPKSIQNEEGFYRP